MHHKELLDAAKSGNLSVLESLDSKSLNESVVDEDKANCLHYAARGGNVDVVEFLVKKRGFGESKRTRIGSTPLHDAAAAGKLDVLKWLIENTPAVVDDQDGTGATILHLAARYGHPVTYKWLLDNTKCDPMKKAASGALPIHFAVAGRNLHVVKNVLAETPRTINLQMDNGATSVYVACQEGHLDILKHLVLHAGGSVKMKAYDGMSCLHAAAQNGHLDCVKWMIEEQKFNPNDRDFDGATPLHYAASNGHTATVEWLLNHGGGKVTLDNMGGSPLHNAAELGQLECVKCLLENGCSADITDNSGLTAAELAERCYHDKCANEIKAKLNSVQEIQLESYNSFRRSLLEENKTSFVSVSDYKHSEQSSKFRQPDSVQPSSSKDYIHQSKDLEDHTRYPKSTTSRLNITLKSPTFPVTPSVVINRDCVKNEECVQSGETGECETKSVSSSECLQSQETGECESLRDKQLSEEDLSSLPEPPPSPPPDYPLPSHHQRTNSDISSVVSSLSNSSYQEDVSVNKLSFNGSVRQGEVLKPVLLNENCSKKSDISTSVSLNSSITQNMNHSEDSVLEKPENYLAKDVVIDETSTTTNTEKPLTNGVDADITKNNTHQVNQKIVITSVSKQENKTHHNGVMQDELQNGTKSTQVAPPPPPVIPPISPMIPNGDISKPERPRSLAAEIQSISLHSSRSASPASRMLNSSSPVNVNHDFVAELKKATGAGVNNLKKTKKPSEGGQMTMVYSFGGKTALDDKSKPSRSSNSKEASVPMVLEGEFDPKNFLDKVSQTDPHGNPIPSWKKQMVARQLAEKCMIETTEKRKQEELEARFKNMPAWKRALIEKKEAEAAQTRAAKVKEDEEKKKPLSSRLAISTKLSPFEQGLQNNKS